ncbi:MAG: phosphoribosylaminoimidazolesuccinocarboxamide synthase [Verrucomicrobiae bacterium]|nr:phosphoribosylaminoimidazolesuccinocarboxamide synthase [Verrucomicrobiae bacterium]
MNKEDSAILQVDIPGLKKVRSGKVREIFDLGSELLFVATDRISAFDCILPVGIPEKGTVLTAMSRFWFEKLGSIAPNHVSASPLPQEVRGGPIERRAMVVRKTQPLAIECVVRGYLAGSGWKEYNKSGTVCGIPLPKGLQESSALPEPIFTPATKAETGHDENISFEEAVKIVGKETAEKVRDLSLRLYKAGRDHAKTRGVIIADTKFEFGLLDGKIYLIDEVLTPDSSRFWPADQYEPGREQKSLDKQYVRDYLEGLSWDKKPPAPTLPAAVVAKTKEKYFGAYEALTGKKLAW